MGRSEIFAPEGNAMPESEKHLTLEQRMELFQALVEAQDGAMTVAQSRRALADRFGVSEAQVRAIEREGLDGNWPPL
jgi:hypothetical protein